MEIRILELVEGARKAEGLAVIIDVFRAFSVACYVFQNGAQRIYPVSTVDEAITLRNENPSRILIGEVKGKRPEGFAYGNSPTQVQQVDFEGKQCVQRTGAGTQGIVNASRADIIITGSFVNAQAVIEYIKAKNPAVVSLVAMGHNGVRSADEDVLFAKYVKNALEGYPNNFDAIKQHLRGYESAQKFFNSELERAPEDDFHLSLSLDKVDFVLELQQDKDRPYLVKKELRG